MSRAAPILGIVLLVAMLAVPFVATQFWLNMLVLALIYSIAVSSITVLTGYVGLLSFGQAGFVGVGAYTYGVLSVGHWPAAVCAVAGMVVPALLGLLLALPAARLKGHYLAIGTLGFGVLIGQVLNNMVSVTRGPMGLLGIHPMITTDRTAWYYGMLALSLVLVGLLHLVETRTFLGVMLKSIKHDEISASASGVGAFGVKLLAFSASAFLAGLCGVLLAAYLRFLTPDLFLTDESFRYLLMAVVGGIGSAGGGWIAALLLTLLPEGLRALGEGNVRLLVYGVMVLSVLWFVPGGIGSLFTRARQPRIRGTSRATPAMASTP